jgi:hypothetical protein
MKHPILFPCLLLLAAACSANDENPALQQQIRSYEYVRSQFAAPAQEYGTSCWWWWLNGNVTKEAITRDLEAMKARNFEGAVIIDAGGQDQRGNRNVPAGPEFGSPEWNDLFVFALSEARRLGLEIDLNIQSGWNLGGPMVTPEYAAKKLTYSETKVSGGTSVSLMLPKPQAWQDFYKDIAILAVPLKTETKEVIDNLDWKLSFAEVGMSASDCSFLLGNSNGERQKAPESYIFSKDDVVDLTAQTDSAGGLQWNVPEGEWSVLRIGYTCTGAQVSTSSDTWKGLVIDYLSPAAFDFYWSEVMEPVMKAASEYAGSTFRSMETDSWECGGMNWTEDFQEYFRKYNGYDLLDYLPVIAGYVVGSLDESHAFMADFRRTIADMIFTNHYSRFASKAAEYGMNIQPESSGPHAAPIDGIRNYSCNGVAMSEFWARSPHRPTPESRFYVKQAASAAHIFGKPIVGAESFTTIGPHWNDELWENQKPAFDHEICSGLNRAYFHTFTCSPAEMGIPGQQYFAGTHVNPEVTWWSRSDAFMDYLRRIHMLSQSGRFCADALYYYGDNIPNIFTNKFSDPAGVLPGYDYDVIDEGTLLALKVRDGNVVVPSGLEYKVLALPRSKMLSLEALRKVRSLLKSGATIIGSRPERLVSLKGGEDAQKEFKKILDELWGQEEKGEKKYGKGTLAWGISVNEYLAGHGVKPDFSIVNLAIDSGYDAMKGNEDVLKASQGIDYIHYSLSDAEYYFVTNQREARVRFDAEFRVSGLRPEIWNALDGSIRYADAYSMGDGTTSVPLILEPYESAIIIFKEKADSEGTGKANYPEYADVASLDGPWTVSFDPQWGGPDKPVTFKTLQDWTTNSDPGIRCYSGTAEYSISFDLSPVEGERYFLELGDVRDVGIAAVKINGKDKGTLWTAPFRTDITDALVSGVNALEVEVINSWYNRVAGDEMGVSPKRYTQTNVVLGNDFQGRPLENITLQASGLLGPVKVCKAE